MPVRSAPRPSSRIASLDAARALGVVAMVVGHTLDAIVALSVRDAPLAVAYWKARGLTAPVFMASAGWAVVVAVERSGAVGLAVPARRLPRVALLLALGYALRWPGWGIASLAEGDPGAWAHLLAFDALHVIAVSLLVSAHVLALPWTRREKAGAFVLLAVLAVALGMGGSAPLALDPAALPPPPVAMAIAQAIGGTSPFPVFPWAAYFFAGAAVGLVVGEPAGRRALALGAVGAALVAGTCWAGVGTMPASHPALVAFRVGAVLSLFAALSAVPAGVGARLAPLGRASLGVYVAHLPIVYGWSTWSGLAQRIGPALPAGAALAIAAAVLVASLALRRAARELAAAVAVSLGRLVAAGEARATTRRALRGPDP